MSKRHDYRILLEISQAIATVRNRADLFEFIVDKVQPVFGFNQYSNICIYNQENHTLQIFSTKMNDDEQSESRIPTFVQSFNVEGIFQKIVESDDIIITDESWKTSPKTATIDEASAQIWRDLNFKYALSIALRSFGKLSGTFHVHFDKVPPFTKADLQLFKSISEQVAVAVANILANEEIVQLAEERHQRAEEAMRTNEALQRSMKRLSSEATPDAFVLQLHRELCELLGGEVTAQFRLDWGAQRILGGMILDNGKNVVDEISLATIRHSFNEIPAWQNGLEEDRIMMFNPEVDAAVMSQYTVEFMRERKLKWLINLPLFVKEKPAWVIAVLGRDDSKLTDRNLDLFRQLSRQLTLALELKQLSDEAEQTAIAREQEAAAQQRARELEETNALLSRSMQRLSNDASPDVFVLQLHYELCELLGGDATAQFRLDWKTQKVSGGVIVDNGQIAQTENNVFKLLDQDFEDIPAWKDNLEKDRLLLFDVNRDAQVMSQLTVKFMRERGYFWLVNLPLFVRDRPAWVIAITGSDNSKLTERNLEQFKLLSRQLTLALEMRQLADEAREAAIFKEKERAAQKWAAELVKVNEALRGGFEKLVESQSIESILDVFVLEAIRATGADGGAVLRHVGSGTEFEFATIAQGENITSETLATEFVATHGEISRRDPARVFARILSGEFVVVRVEELSEWYPLAADYHRARGNQVIWNVPFYISGKVVGYLGLALRELREPDRVMRETLDALAMQACMAMELRQKSDEAKDAAVAREHERAAQERAAELMKVNDQLIIANREIQDREREKAFLLSISEQLSAIRNLNDILVMIYGEFKSLFGFELAVLSLYDEPGESVSHLHYPRREFNLDNLNYQQLVSAPVPLKNNPHEIFRTYVEPVILTPDEFAAQYPLHVGIKTMRELGLEESIIMPLKLGKRTLGMLEFHAAHKNTFRAVSQNLYKNLAEQTAVAVSNILANEEVAELSEERRRRAEQLAKSNEALGRTSARLAEQPDLTAFLSQVVIESANQLNADAGHLVIYNEERDVLQTAALIEYGSVVPLDPLAAEMPANEVGFFTLLRQTNQPRYFDIESESDLFWRGSVDYLREHGQKSVYAFPLVAGEMMLGVMGLAFSRINPITEQQSELINALAHQAALAIQLTKLADKAKEAAILKEKERAAQERARELAQTNEALRGSIEQLSGLDNLNAFLGTMVQSACAATGAVCGAIFLFDEALHEATLQIIVQDGQICDIENDPDLSLWRGRFSLNDPFWTTMLKGFSETREVFRVSLDNAIFAAEPAAWHRAQRHVAIADFPLWRGEKQLFGIFGLAFREPENMTSAQMEMVSVLAQQATLALKLTRLSDKARREAEVAATFSERNRIAREIHDTLAQGFTGVIVQLNMAKRLFGKTTPSRVGEFVDRSIELARESLSEARRSVQALRLPDQKDEPLLDLSRLLREKLESITEGTSIKNKISISGTPFALPLEATVNLLRIGQEAITNVLRHAQAGKIEIEIIYSTDEVCLCVRDDGSGFDPARPNSGYGLRGMSERVEQIGAKLEIESQPGRGTIIKASLNI